MAAQVRSPLIVDQNLLDPDAPEDEVLDALSGSGLPLALLLAAGAGGGAYAYMHRKIPIKAGDTWVFAFQASSAIDNAEFLQFVSAFETQNKVVPVSFAPGQDQRTAIATLKFTETPNLHFRQTVYKSPKGVTWKIASAGPAPATTTSTAVSGESVRAISNLGAAHFSTKHFAQMATPQNAAKLMSAARSSNPRKAVAAQALIAAAGKQAKRGNIAARTLVAQVGRQYTKGEVVVVQPGGLVKRVPRANVKGL